MQSVGGVLEGGGRGARGGGGSDGNGGVRTMAKSIVW